MIKMIETVSEYNQIRFTDELIRVVNDMQKQGFEVEVQFSTAGKANMIKHSALILGHQKPAYRIDDDKNIMLLTKKE